jgi:molybdopterin-guanine dinucleotide biosynthesis protein A
VARGDWVGAVLTGGASRRMGRDKATIEVDGEAMAVRVANALRDAGATDVACIGPAVGALTGIAEDAPGEGPLGAVVAALRWAGGVPVVVAACDLVAPIAPVFAEVAAALAESAADVAVPLCGGRRQPLAAAYAPTALNPLATAFDAGERSITAALDGLRVVEVPGIDPAGLADADEPGDLPR